MTTASAPVRSDREIQNAVREELDWMPDVHPAGIGIAVDDGVVELSGEVGSYPERRAAVKAAQRVRGVVAVADELVVHPLGSLQKTDVDIAKAVQHALDWSANIPATVRAEVKDHVVTLTGDVDWNYQRTAAQRATERLAGVHGVHNLITLTPRPESTQAQSDILRAIHRNADIDAHDVHVRVEGRNAVLRGSVRSWMERSLVEAAAWSSHAIAQVDNGLIVHVG